EWDLVLRGHGGLIGLMSGWLRSTVILPADAPLRQHAAAMPRRGLHAVGRSGRRYGIVGEVSSCSRRAVVKRTSSPGAKMSMRPLAITKARLSPKSSVAAR